MVGPSNGFVQYEVSIVGFNNSILPMDIIVTESVVENEEEGFLDFTLSVISEKTNFTYSRNVNTSSVPIVFPYLSGLTNQSFSYTIQDYSISASLVNSGKIPISFNDNMYEGKEYLVSFQAADNTGEELIFADGEVVCMPSGLIYSIELWFNDLSFVEILLVSTDLNLTNLSNNVDPLGAAILGGGVIFAVLIAVPPIYKKILNKNRSKKNDISRKEDLESVEENKENPSYWVD
jgi:hypothetical protein